MSNTSSIALSEQEKKTVCRSIGSKRIEVLNTPIDALSMQETLAYISHCIKQRKHIQQVVVNAAKIVKMQKDEALRKSVVESDIINADGQAVVWAARFLNKPLPERVTGIDLMENLVKLAAEEGYRIFFLGAREETLNALLDKYRSMYGDAIIAGARNGYFSRDEDKAVAREIAETKADMLFVAISSPIKEVFINKYKDLMQVPYIMGVGGSFDVVTGKVKRAPGWMQRYGLEWLYRVLQEPGRLWKRYLITNTAFLSMVLRKKFKK